MGRPPGDAEFTEFVAARWRPLYRTAYLLIGDHALAEDLVQTALTKTYVAWGRIRAVEAGDSYAHKTLVRTAMMWWRRKSWRAERPHARLPDELPRTVDPTDGLLDQRDWVWREIQRLAPRQRAVVVLRYYEDLSERQIAETLGCSAGTVKRQAHDALATLRKALGDELVPELAKQGSS